MTPRHSPSAAAPRAEVAGLDPAYLKEAGIETDAALFLLGKDALRLADAAFFRAGAIVIQGPPRFSLEVDLKSGRGRLRLTAPSGSGLTLGNCSAERVEADEFNIRAGAALPDVTGFLSAATKASRTPAPAAPRGHLQGSGFTAGAQTVLDAPWTAFGVDAGSMILGNDRGEVLRVENGQARTLWQSPAQRPIGVVRAADIDADGAAEIMAGDDAENLYAVSSSGRLLWSAHLTKYMGENANATDIAAGPAAAGWPAVFAATNGFKILAFDARGRLCWENLVRYHRQTQVRTVEDGGRLLVVVGTVYSTPVNVFDGATGRALWHTWDQVGDEMNSTTDYCGIHLTDMLFLDADRDGSKEVVFGTKYNRVYALRLRDGATAWEANVGDEVRCLKAYIDSASGEDRIVAGMQSGDVVVIDGRGRRRARVGLGSAVAGLEILPSPGRGPVKILAGSDDGQVLVFDERLSVSGSFDLSSRLEAAVRIDGPDGRPGVLLLSGKTIVPISFIDYPLRKSRVH